MLKIKQIELIRKKFYAGTSMRRISFIIQLNGIIGVPKGSGKFSEKKARGLLYDSITKQLNLLRKQRSQETGLQLRDISRDSLRKKTQRAEKVYKFFEIVGLDKIKYIKSYCATSISELTNEQIQEVIDYGISLEQLPLVTDHVTKISETLCPGKNCLRILHQKLRGPRMTR